jgi:hypothetical protein
MTTEPTEAPTRGTLTDKCERSRDIRDTLTTSNAKVFVPRWGNPPEARDYAKPHTYMTTRRERRDDAHEVNQHLPTNERTELRADVERNYE